MNKRVWILVAALAAGALCASCAEKSAPGSSTAAATSGKSVNMMCCCGKPLDNKTTTTYKGKTVGFCGPACLSEWSKMSEKDKDAKLAAATKPAK